MEFFNKAFKSEITFHTNLVYLDPALNNPAQIFSFKGFCREQGKLVVISKNTKKTEQDSV